MTSRERLDLILRLIDLTTLESTDTPASVEALCGRARRPDAEDPGAPPVAAVCVHPRFAEVAVRALAGSGVTLACVAGGFPAGIAPVSVKVSEAQAAVAAGASEIDLTIDRAAFLAGRHVEVQAEVAAVRAALESVRLKVILETGELGGPEQITAAAELVMAAGADMLKTSTGKGRVGATPAAARALLVAAAGFERRTGRAVGVKVSGGVRTVADALGYLDLAESIGGPSRLTPELFRFGASALLDAVLAARRQVSAPTG